MDEFIPTMTATEAARLDRLDAERRQLTPERFQKLREHAKPGSRKIELTDTGITETFKVSRDDLARTWRPNEHAAGTFGGDSA